MPASHRFEHLSLVLSKSGPAFFPQARISEDPTTATNKANRSTHAAGLRGLTGNVSSNWQTQQQTRIQDGLPAIDAGIPLLLRIDTSLDLDDLRGQFQFEIVSEQEDGFVIVASEDLDLTEFRQKLTEFDGGVRGSANVAKIHELREDLTQEERLRRILTETLFQEWPTIADDSLHVYDVSITCIGNWDVPKPFRPRKNWGAHANQRHMEGRAAEIATAYEQWDELQYQRSNQARLIVDFHDGKIVSEFHGKPTAKRAIPDYFTMRIRMSGKGYHDFVLNYPYIFAVEEPDDIETPQQIARDLKAAVAQIDIDPPDALAPAVCVIDSGMQEEHVWLEPGIDKATSHCFLPGVSDSDVADYVKPGGHGTRVGGAVLHGEDVPKSGTIALENWIQNARVLDNDCDMPTEMFPPSVLREVVKRYHEGKRKTRIFNHSINANASCRTRHMSAWAAEIDLLCNDCDILIIQSSGNVRYSHPVPFPGIREHLAAGRTYPDYLGENACRIANPAQSFQALTVGSIAHGTFDDGVWRSLAPENGHPSAFSRAGLGIWGSIKPEVVEYGGDCLVTNAVPPDVDTPQVGRKCYPELVRSTLHHGPAFDRDVVGTSFAAPKVARIAARLQSILPDEPCLLYRALIIQSARWPEWAKSLPQADQADLLRRIGYGLPDIHRATENTDYRTTYITHQERSLGAGDCHVYQVPIPDDLRRPGSDYNIRIDVTLSYAAAPRRTRRTRRGYLATWLDWRSIRKGESIGAFLTRSLKSDDERIEEGSGGLGWTIHEMSQHGLPGVTRQIGTAQKDWAYVKSHALPDDLCIAVRGHRGWSNDPDSVARYTLAVTIEIVGQEIPVYELLRTATLELQSEVEAEVEAELELEV
jgi:subtilase family protein